MRNGGIKKIDLGDDKAMQIKKIVAATGNKNKLKEFREIFPDIEFISQRDAGFLGDVEEDGATFEENALIKARAVASALGCAALADDSGLCVDFLGGAPGVHSARFSGVHGDDKANRALLLKKLAGIEDNMRTARFCSAIALVFPNGKSIVGYGETYGRILTREEGDNGFGYDSLFFSFDLNKSFGVASDKEKNSVSHRFRALINLKEKLNSL